MALQKIWLMKYHNYYSRKVDYGTTPFQLIDLGASTIKTIDNYNFKLNNGINTSVIINDVDDVQNCDYVLITEAGGTIKSKILSRWYIMSITKIRENQHQLNLQRDVIPDFWGKIYNKDMIISRCLLPENNHYVLNKENKSFNQIKKDEILLKDKSNCGWLVGYLPSDCTDIDKTIEAYISNNQDTPDFSFNSINDFPYKIIAHPFYYNNQKIKRDGNKIIVDFKLQDKNNVEKVYRFIYDEDAQKIIRDDERAITGDVTINNNFSTSYGNRLYEISFSNTTAVYVITKEEPYDFDLIAGDVQYALLNRLLTYETTDITTSVIDWTNDYNVYNGRVIKINNINYKVNLINTGEKAGVENSNIDSTFETTVLDLLNRDTILDYCTQLVPFNSGSILPSVAYNIVYYDFDKMYNTIKTVISSDKTRQHCYDSGGFDIFCLPYSSDFDYDQSIASNRDVNLAISNAIMTAFSGQSIDLQLLPYCPFISSMEDGWLDTSNLIKTEIKDSSEEVIGYVFWLKTSSFKLNISTYIGSTESKKVLNETKMWRLCSPNYSSQFEFNIAKLDKQAGPFNVNVTLKPYNPYIRVAPAFSDMYGRDFNDKRGLILAGDYSLPLVSSAWASYELNNKNYEKAFNREIESLELSNKMSLVSDIANIATGAIGSGLMTGGVVSKGAGIASGIISGVAGIADVAVNSYLRKENISKQKDLFNYQIDNIKAMPTTVNKGTPLDINYKMWPVVEEYSASDEEIEEFKEFIKYRSMTANIIDTLQNVYNYSLYSDFMKFDYYYIEAMPISLDDIGSYEISNYLSNELNQGFFLRNQRGQI